MRNDPCEDKFLIMLGRSTPADDGDAPAPMRVQRVQRARSDVVEYTKSATGGVVEQPARARVMARRAHDAERVAVAAEQHAVDGKLDGARRSPGGVERSDVEAGVGDRGRYRLRRGSGEGRSRSARGRGRYFVADV